MKKPMHNTPFLPTALLVMEHNVTGMKYFCKTTLLDRVSRYKGSGIAWRKHLKEHGMDVKMGLLGFYVEEERCREAAKKFCQEFDVVKSDQWANLVEETGRNGAIMKGEQNPFYGKTHSPETIDKIRLKNTGNTFNKGAYRSPEYREKMSAILKGRKNPNVSAKLKGRKLSEETKAKIGLASKSRIRSPEEIEKIRQASLAQWAKVRASKIELPAEENQ